MLGVLSLAIFLPLAAISAAQPDYPDDAFSCPAEDRWDCFETVTGVQPPGNPVQRLAQWDVNQLRAVLDDGPARASWPFVCKPGQGAVLCFSDRIRRMPRAVSVRVDNRGTRAAAFAVSMVEIPWVPGTEGDCRNWAVNGDAPVAAGEEFDQGRVAFIPLGTMNTALSGRACP